MIARLVDSFSRMRIKAVTVVGSSSTRLVYDEPLVILRAPARVLFTYGSCSPGRTSAGAHGAHEMNDDKRMGLSQADDAQLADYGRERRTQWRRGR